MKLLDTKKGAMQIDKTIEIVLAVFIFASLIGTIAATINTTITENGSAVTGGSAILLGLTTLILVIGFIMMIYKSQKK